MDETFEIFQWLDWMRKNGVTHERDLYRYEIRGLQQGWVNPKWCRVITCGVGGDNSIKKRISGCREMAAQLLIEPPKFTIH